MLNTEHATVESPVDQLFYLDFGWLFPDISNIMEWPNPLEVSDAHNHTTPITSLPRQRAVGAGQRRQSIDWMQRRRRRSRKEPQATSSRGGGDLSEISAPWAFLPHTGKTRAQTAATALRTLRGSRVNCAACTLSGYSAFTSHWFHQ